MKIPNIIIEFDENDDIARISSADDMGLIDVESCDFVSQKIKHYRRSLSNALTMADFSHIASDAEWVFNPYNYRLCNIRNCVYFGWMNPNRHIIKIGSAAHLSSRVKGYKTSHGSRLNIIACAITEEFRELERYLIAMFYPFRVSGFEWFDSDPVDTYLESMRSIYQW